MALSTISGTTGITDATITSAKLADFTAAVDLNGVELLLDQDCIVRHCIYAKSKFTQRSHILQHLLGRAAQGIHQKNAQR